MEMKKLVGVVLAVVAIAAIAMWLHPSESKRIRRVFAKVSKEIRKEGPEGLVVSTAKAHALADLVATGARFEIDEHVIRGASDGRQLIQQIVLVRSQSDKIEVGFTDIAIAFDGERTASVTADVYVRGLSSELGISGRDARALEAVMVKDGDDGKWRFKRVAVSPIVSELPNRALGGD